jgi:hypothetical protein
MLRVAGGGKVEKAFAEFRSVRLTDPLRQGDVIESADAQASMWERHLLVITADCDFAHDKHQGRVTCVPLLTVNEYLLEMQIPRMREKLIKRPVSELLLLVEKSSGYRMTGQRLREWAREAMPESVVASLGLTGLNAQKAIGNLRAIRLIDGPADDIDSAIRVLVDAQLEFDPPAKPEAAMSRVVDPMRQVFSQPPGDALFISAIAESYDVGYFAYLRHLEQVSQPSISLGSTRQNIAYRRISRLEDRYTFALVQRFASVFLSIGLPDEYETLRNLHADSIGVSK